MNRMHEPQLDRGVLIQVDRQRAKQLFAAKQPDALLEFLEMLVRDEALRQNDQVVDLASLWQPIQKAFGDPRVVSDETEREGLAFCLLGGRPLPSHSNWFARMVRPDIVANLATVLARINVSTLEENWPDPDSMDRVGDRVAAIGSLYQQAAADQAAVVFAARQP